MDRDARAVTKRILELSGEIFRAIRPVIIPVEWMKSDLTAAQLRVLLALYTEGPSRMSSIASYMGIAVSTATGVVDNLVKKGLAMRRADPEDRRLVICELSPNGRELVGRLWSLGEYQIEKMVNGLSPEQLQMAEELAGAILNNISSEKEALTQGI